MKNIISLLVISFLITKAVFAQNVLVVDQYGGGQYITINAALTAAAAGDTIKVMPGLYQEQIILTKKIHFLAMDTTVVLDYQTNYTFYFNSGSNGSSLQGFKIRKPLTAASGLKDILIAANIFDSTTVTLNMGAGSVYFMNNLLRNTPVTATNSSEKVIIFNNRFTSATTTATLLSISGGNVIVAKNEFNGGAISIYTGSNTNIIANKILNSAGYGVRFSESGNIAIKGNLIKNIGTAGVYGDCSSGSSAYYGASYSISVQNNIIQNGGSSASIQIFAGSSSAAVYQKTMKANLKNNILISGGRGIYFYGNWRENSLFDVKNNIIAFNTIEGIAGSYSVMSADFNCTFSNGNNVLSGTGNLINVNPLFTNVSNDDYSLQLSSPCIDAGSPIPQDYDLDRSRNDMGIFGGSYNWDNINSGINNARVLELFLAPVATAQGNTITITGSAVGNKQNPASLDTFNNKNTEIK